MKKLYTLMAALLATAAVSANAKTVTWSASDLSATYASNDYLNNVTIKVNDFISFTFSNGTATSETNYVKFRKQSQMTSPGVAFFPGNTLTVNATNAEITSLQFLILTDGTTTDYTPTWVLNIGDETFDSSNDTWTGEAEDLTVVGGKKATIIGLTFEYNSSLTFENSEIFFNETMLPDGTNPLNPLDFTITENNVTFTVKTTSSNAAFSQQTNYFYTSNPAEYITLSYRYQPGTSTNIKNGRYGLFTFPCDGTLYIYAYNNQSTDRSLQIEQNSVVTFTHTYTSTDYETIEELPDAKIYPIFDAEVKEGQAYLLWPENQVTLCGFEFVPEGNEPGMSGVENVISNVVEFDENAPEFDLLGRPVNDNYKGVVIKGGKKFIRR